MTAPAIRSVLAAYRSTESVITKDQITDAWTEYDALSEAAPPCCRCGQPVERWPLTNMCNKCADEAAR